MWHVYYCLHPLAGILLVAWAGISGSFLGLRGRLLGTAEGQAEEVEGWGRAGGDGEAAAAVRVSRPHASCVSLSPLCWLQPPSDSWEGTHTYSTALNTHVCTIATSKQQVQVRDCTVPLYKYESIMEHISASLPGLSQVHIGVRVVISCKFE